MIKYPDFYDNYNKIQVYIVFPNDRTGVYSVIIGV